MARHTGSAGSGRHGESAPFSGRTPESIPYRRPPAAVDEGGDPLAPGPVGPPESPGPSAGPRTGAVPGRRRSTPIVVLVLAVLLVVAVAAVVVRWERSRSGAPILAGPAESPPPWPGTGSPGSSRASSPGTGSPGSSRPPPTGNGPSRSPRPPAPAPAPAPRRTASPSDLPVSSLHLTADAKSVTIRTADLGSFLMRVIRVDGGTARASTPDNGKNITVSVEPKGRRINAVEIAVDRSVRWNVDYDGVTDRTVIDMAGGPVGRIQLPGSSEASLNLPAPDGVTDVRISGSTGRCTVRTPRRVAARLTVTDAGRVSVDGQVRTAGRGRTVLVDGGNAPRRIDFRAGDVGTLTWDRS